MENIVALNKPRGLTPLQAIMLYRKTHPELENDTISYAGRLDPMAEGLLLILIGDANKQRSKFEELTKVYEFSFIPGIRTDTYDVLGRITRTSLPHKNSIDKLTQILRAEMRTFDQPYPPYSSMHVKGKPLFYWAREGKLDDITIPTKKVSINSLELSKIDLIPRQDMITTVTNDVARVQGKFRQEEILQDWKTKVPSDWKNLSLIHCVAEVSSGTYIRSLVHRIGEAMGCGAVAYSIKRIQAGQYSIKDALILP